MPDKHSDYIDLVNQKLRSLVPKNILGLERVLNVSGKRWRPGLVITIAQHSNIAIDDQVVDAASAVELVHLASLIHDDVMDSGSMRHGIPTINAKEGANSAILAGDYLIAKGCLLAYRASAEAGMILAETVADLCEGQAKELEDEFNLDRTQNSMLDAIRGKTSSMFIAACNIGGILSGFNHNDMEALNGFAENLGIAYQYADDINDLVQTPEDAGKSVGIDIREGKYTLPIILSINGKNGQRLKKLLQEQEMPLDAILNILYEDTSIESARKQVGEHKQKALESLDKITNKNLVASLEAYLHKF